MEQSGNGRIHLLPRALADLIAAGEVVERPASVVKELVENAIDAGADKITIEIKNGGVSYMRVTDNGCGMSREDAARAFLRHATSKLHTAEELAGIATLGFRGEALAALAAVARVELMTKEKGAVSGTLLRVAASDISEPEDAGCPEGTTLVVRDLFFNTPARQKFLKKEVTEAAQVAAAVDRAALANPGIAFRFFKDGREELTTAGDGSLQNVVYQIYGRELCAKMVPVDYTMDKITVRGFAGRPEASRPNRNMQNFFLNGRYVKSRVFTAALEEAMKNSVMTERFPLCVLNVQIDPRLVDINVHPAKLEVKFTYERPVYDAVYFAVQSALRADDSRAEFRLAGGAGRVHIPRDPDPGERAKQTFLRMAAADYREQILDAGREKTARSTPARPGIEREESGEGVEAPAVAYRTERGAQPRRVDLDVRYSDYVTEESERPRPQMIPQAAGSDVPASEAESAAERTESPAAAETEQKAAGQEKTAAVPGRTAPDEHTQEQPEELSFRVVGELYRTYIIVELESEMLLIDKHAAQERIHFERLRAARQAPEMQALLAPVPVQLERAEYATVLSHLGDFEQLGFSIEDFGGGSVLVRAVPMDISGQDAAALVVEIAGKIASGAKEIEPAIYDELLHSIACKAAMKGGQKNAPEDLENLVRQLLAMPDIRYCPHGRPVAVATSKSQIERQFMRAV